MGAKTLRFIQFFVLVVVVLPGCQQAKTPAADTPTPPKASSVPKHRLATAGPDAYPSFTPTAVARIEPSRAPTSTHTSTPTTTKTRTPTPPPLEVQIDQLDERVPSTPLVFSFNQPMTPGRATSLLDIRPEVAGQARWNETYTTLTFAPNEPFDTGSAFRVSLDPELRSASGAVFSRRPNWTITILDAPEVERRVPGYDVRGERSPTYQLIFSRKMDPESLQAAVSVEPTVPLDVSYRDGTLTVKCRQPLAPGTRYLFTLAPSALDVYGIPLVREYRWTHRLDELITSTTWPDAGGARGHPIIIRFGYPMDVKSVQESLVIAPPIQGALSWDDRRTTVTYTPDAPLPNSTEYTVRFDGALFDARGDRLPPPATLTFKTPPPILAFTPMPEKVVAPNSQVRITFDRPMDHALTAASFTISPSIPGDFAWHETTLIFTPDSGFFDEYGTYSVNISAAARDADGDTVLREPHAWSFHTGEMADVANFGWGPNAQVVDTDGRRAVQFGMFQSDPIPLTFELYRLELEQFLDRYASGFRGVAGREDRSIETKDTVLVKRWRLETPRGKHTYGNVHEVLIPGDVPPGSYILNLTAGHLNDQLILLLTRHTIALKQAQGQIVAWVTDINGGSVRDIGVEVYGRDGVLISQGRTDEYGVFRAAVSRDPQPLIVIARDGSDISASGLSNEWRSRAADHWSWWWRPTPTALDYAVYVYTDRPIYRPGQMVHFKSIIRKDDDARLGLLAEGAAVTARVRDARNNIVQTWQLATNHYGTVNGDFQLGQGAMLGEYEIEIVLDSESYRQVFKVEDYQKPDYRIDVEADAERYVVGETITVSVGAEYFYGEPVPDAQLSVQLYELGERYWWDDELDDQYIWYPSSKGGRRGRTDANGHYTFTLDAMMGNYASGIHWQSDLEKSIWGIEVTADDGSHQTVSSFVIVQVFNGSEDVRLDTGGFVQVPGRPFSVRVSAAMITGEPAQGRSLRLDLRRYDSRSNDYDRSVDSIDLTTDSNGKAIAPLTVEGPGYYQLRINGSHNRNEALGYTTWIYVIDDVARWIGRGSEIRIAADREIYAPGDVAKLIIESPFDGPALLTFERGTTRREQLIEMSAPMTVVEVLIQPEFAPNIFVTVNAWQEQDTALTPNTYQNLPDSQLHTASVELRVPVTDRTLIVTITPDQPGYAPRERANFVVRVTDGRGAPMAAEVSLALVDEAIFSLSDELAGPIFDAFYRERDLLVRTYDALALTRYIPDWGRGGGGGGADDFGGNPRSDFPDTAAWLPVLHTDWRGEVTVTLTLPDSLTSWRLTAKAVTPDTQVGETFINVLTHQAIVVRPIAPRILTAGDRIELSALVHNYSDDVQQVVVSIKTDGVEIEGPITQTISLAPDATRVVGWMAVALEAGDAEITVVAAAGEVGDAVQLTLPVRPLAVPDVKTRIGEFSGEFNTSVFLPDGALDLSSVKIELSRSIAGSLLTGLEYLTGFPYGCVEQTMSRALPNAVVGRAFHNLGVGNPALQADLPPKINAGLQRLYGYQHNDGGWGWWYDDSSHDYQTAWVVFGLAVTADAGHGVDPEVIRRGADWLLEHLSQMDLRTRAFALYSLATAGYGDAETSLALAGQVEKLDAFSQAALALSLWELGETAEARAIVEHLARTAMVDDGEVHWTQRDEDGHYYRKTMASTTRSTALALSAFVRIDGNHSLEPGIVRWLMAQRRQDGWGTTNETSFAILALTDHLLSTELAMADTQYSIELNGDVIAGGDLGRGEPTASVEVPAGQMVRGLNSLLVRQSGGGQLYYAISSRVYVPEKEIAAAGDVRIDRTYHDAKTSRPIRSVKTGQLVQVVLKVNMPDDAFYVIVEDNLPGGLSALNEGLNTTSHEGRAHAEPRYYWQDYGYNQKEVHGDRVSFFVTELEKGSHTFTYLARATHAGGFIALSAEAWAMYDLTVWGRSASGTFEVAISSE